MMHGRQVAHGIGCPRVAGEQVCLTTAPAKIDLTTVAASARLTHPCRTTEPLEGVGVKPDTPQPLVACVRKDQPRDLARALTRQHETIGRYGHEDPPTAVQTCFWIRLKIVGHHVQYLRTPPKPRAGRVDDRRR